MGDEKTEKPARKKGKGQRRGGCLFRLLLWLVLVPVGSLWLLGFCIGYFAAPMLGMNTCSAPVTVAPADLALKVDLTGADAQGRRVVTRQETFDALLAMVRDAGDTLILDQFLVNRFRGSDPAPFPRDTTAELVAALVAKKAQSPNTWILFITDPVNSAYEERCPPELEPLRVAGVHLLVTDLDQLPDINRVWSPFYRVLTPLVSWLPLASRPCFTNVFDKAAPPMSPLALARLLNFKANHRKTAVMKDAAGRWHTLVSGANPHSGSSAHGNMALQFADGPVRAVVESELTLARNILLHRPAGCYSRTNALELVREVEARLAHLPSLPAVAVAADAATASALPCLSFATEQGIATKAEVMLRGARRGDRIEVLMFYLADPALVLALQDAAANGAMVRLVLDANKDAFGREKNGIPNRVVARELHDWAAANPARNLQIRWFNTHGEQGHFKALRIWGDGGRCDQLLVGSANLTIRNLRGHNLESSVFVDRAGALGQSFDAVFAEVWDNPQGVVHSVDYSVYEIRSQPVYQWRRVVTALANLTGLCTF